MQVDMEDEKRTSSSLSQDILTKKMPVGALEQQIISLEKQRQELLAVNHQWDQQFRRMKQQYGKKVTDVKAQLETMQKSVKELEKERHQMQQECRRLEALATNNLLQEMALQDALKNQSAPLPVAPVNAQEVNCNHEEMKMQVEVLRQQVQIYEEDFKKERSDRERLNEEKEALLRINERIQFQLDTLNSQVKDCQEERELLEKKVKQQARDLQALTEKHGFPHQMFVPACFSCRNCGLLHPYHEPQIRLASCSIHRKQQCPPDYQWYVPDRFPPDVPHKANDASSENEGPHLYHTKRKNRSKDKEPS
nr:TNFAIP3-interacting protein 3 isoform X2 [Zootoca vivipara]